MSTRSSSNYVVNRERLPPLLCKRVPRNSKGTNEVKITQLLRNNPGIIRLEHLTVLDKEYRLYLEYCVRGDLSNIFTGKIDEQTAKKVIKQCLLCLDTCHAHNVVHGDVKPHNFVWTMDNVKLIDFGCSAHLTDKNSIVETLHGSPYFMAPEMLRSEMGLKSDAWSIGVMTYFLVHGKYPFEGVGPKDVLRSIIISEPLYNKNMYSVECYDFMNQLLTKNYGYRTNVQDILQHEWLENNIQH